MVDAIFGDPRLAAVYDALDADRSDLEVYERIVVDELGARSALDIGCGTGTFALMLAARGLDVTGVDPAAASVAVARAKPGADAVRWVVGLADAATGADARGRSGVDVVTMTANVAQVFLDDLDWLSALVAARRALRPGGTLVLESRRPERKAWLEWTPDATRQVVDVPHEGQVEEWIEVTGVDGELVTFSSPTVFHRDGTRIDSTTTLRFRPRAAIEASLARAGLEVVDVRDAPDRPGREWVYLARRPG
ncbi:class I SAM-dependent methyltransferase [Agrococcus sediminis]|uniref:Class I SAM-dependent methyltransferase n=1 Tax=Agrococcus sediminis TaxID=2599924 RepID=A0A5M8QDE8_9MICO|nr:class I SAM-dependent methyltransferase [Agrococcus sediminis]KAA6432920.1 class I SAM-dependent methyltransferase [Agrococcus sediminis]